MLEAWPIVTNSDTFNRDAEKDRYVLIDPAAGLNRFNMFADYYYQPPQFHVGLSYLQNYKKLPDGVSFQQVFTGEATEPVHDIYGNEYNLNRISGTLGLALREYKEGPGFAPIDLPAKEHFFRSAPRIVPNAGYSIQTPVKWNIHPGMKPIQWTISPYVKNLAADPFYGRYDIAGAVKRGVENWNAVFGYKVLEANVGAADATPGDDVTNFVYLDVNPAVGFAFADWRTNPNTGEIRGASVYLNTIWVDFGSFLFDPEAWNARPQKPDLFAAAPKARHRLGWAGMRPETLCEYPVSPLLGEDLATVSSRARVAGTPESAGRTGIQMVEDYLTGVVLHEVGHTLGLRHNFKGSLVPPSSSIMEYIDDYDQVNVFTPQSYDVAALKLLYGISAASPVDPFCTDEDTTVDPDCSRFDVGAESLADFFGPINLDTVRDLSHRPDLPVHPGQLHHEQRGRVRARRRLQLRPHPGLPGRDQLRDRRGAAASGRHREPGQRLLRLHQQEDPARPGLVPHLERQLHRERPAHRLGSGPECPLPGRRGGWLRNTNGVPASRTGAPPRDVLKKVQTSSAYIELLGARSDILAASPTPVDPFVADLLARIDVAVTPYFK